MSVLYAFGLDSSQNGGCGDSAFLISVAFKISMLRNPLAFILTEETQKNKKNRVFYAFSLCIWSCFFAKWWVWWFCIPDLCCFKDLGVEEPFRLTPDRRDREEQLEEGFWCQFFMHLVLNFFAKWRVWWFYKARLCYLWEFDAEEVFDDNPDQRHIQEQLE